MDNDKLMSMLARLFFLGALAFLGMALVEKGLNFIGQSLPLTDAFPSQLLAWTVPLLLFVIAIVLMQMRGELKQS